MITILLAEVLRISFGTRAVGWDNLVYGVLLVLFIIFLPKGILGSLLDLAPESAMDLELSGKVAVVTGTSVGLEPRDRHGAGGRGARTVIVARRANLARDAQDEIERAGGRATAGPAARSLHGRTRAARIRDAALSAYGRVDILINNAGGSRPVPWDSPGCPPGTSRSRSTSPRCAGRTACAPARNDRAALGPRALRDRHRRAVRCQRARWRRRPVCTPGRRDSRARSGRHGITINCLSPGRVHSEQIDQRLHPTPESQAEFARNIPLGYFGDPSDVAFLAAFLCSPKARYITGERIHVDEGCTRRSSAMASPYSTRALSPSSPSSGDTTTASGFNENKGPLSRGGARSGARVHRLASRPASTGSAGYISVDPSTVSRGSMMRIYRDTRFSRDKTPYKTNVGIHFGLEGAERTSMHRLLSAPGARARLHGRRRLASGRRRAPRRSARRSSNDPARVEGGRARAGSRTMRRP